jgi:4-amino-4-deoxy-L-arabinose transferase-like glycosyltransferase
LAATLVLFLLCLARMHPTNWFGIYRDDAIYFSSAKALADGRGYILPSFPGTPPQTKYPVLYPWLLSWVWKWNPTFPDNLGPSVCLTALFSCGFLVLTFQLLRKFKGVGDWPAVAMVAVCASTPVFLMVSGSLMSDSLFMFLATAALLLGDKALRASGRLPSAALVGVLAGLAVLTRSVGLAVVGGIVMAGLFRRALRQAAAVCAGAAPFVLAPFWAGRMSRAVGGAGLPNHSAALPPGWQQTLAYYTSYPKVWRFCVPNVHVFLSVLRGNLGAFLETPAWYWLHPALKIGTGFAATALGAPLMLIALAGILRQARSDEWKPLHFVFALYSGVLLVWNYPVMDRFLLPFLPLFCLGLWVEGKHLAGLLGDALRAGRTGERVLAGVIAAGLAAFAGTAVWNAFEFYRPHPSAQQQAARLRQDKAQAYDWIRENTLPEDRIVACEDGRVYLYTGRQSVIPIAFSTEFSYTHDWRALDRDLARMTDTATVVQAHYWLTAFDDFVVDEEEAVPSMRARVAQLMLGLPEVYRSPDGWVAIYDISCWLQPQRAICASALPVLPAGTAGAKPGAGRGLVR